MGEGWGGGFVQLPNNFFNDGINITEHIVIPKSQHTKSLRSKPLVAQLVFVSLFSMLTTVDFDYQTCFQTNKIHNISIDWKLAAKLASIDLPFPQP